MRAPLTPLKAFLSDSERLSGTETGNGGDDRVGHWLSVAQAAARLASMSPNERSDYALTMSENLLPPKDQRPTQIDGDGSKPLDSLSKVAERFRVEAEEMERAGCFELALVTVSSMSRALSAGELPQRLLASVHMGRVMRGMGDLDNASECYGSVADVAVKAGEGPVAAHGYIGLGNVASERGNKPLQKAHYLDALRYSPLGSPVELSAHMGLMIVARAENNLADALLHGWRAHDLSPPDSDSRFGTITNMARVAHQGGFFESAKAGFDFVIQHSGFPRDRIITIASALPTFVELQLRSDVERLVNLGEIEISNGAPPFEVSMFLLNSAQAWHALSDYSRCDSYANRAEAIGDRHGFNEVRMKADALRCSPRPDATSRRVQRVTPKALANNAVRVGLDRLQALVV